MSINHHLDAATLFSYAAGSLPQGMALVVACHLSMCDHCKSRIRETEVIGGALLDAMPPAELESDMLQQLLQRLDVPADPVESEAVVTMANSEIPQPLAQYIGDTLDNLEWKRIVPGICYYDLPFISTGFTRLLRVAPGRSVLPHSHIGSELTLMLRGSQTDEVGRFSRGDVSDLDDQIEHQPQADAQEGCICLVATDAPLRFTTMLGRLLQPITGF